MADYKELKFSRDISEEDDDARIIVNNLKEVVCAAATINFGKKNLINTFSMDSSTYYEKEAKTREAVLKYAAQNSGIKKLEDKRDVVRAFDNDTFVSIVNGIVSETLSGVVTNTGSSQLMSLCNIDDVDLGDNRSYPIETKGLPIAQRSSYMNNVIFSDSYTTTPITVTPKVYTIGSSIDYIRILSNGYDWGKELARVALGMLYAQYKLVVGILFNTANVTGTPMYKSSWTADGYVAMIEDLKALNKADVKAYGTLQAFNKQGSLATTSYGFESQDRMINDGMLGRAYGVDNIVIDQATDLSAPFTDANRSNLLLIPTNKILLISDIGDKPIKLVRENFVRVFSKEAKDGSLYKQNYSYSMAFDAGLVTAGHYAIQAVS